MKKYVIIVAGGKGLRMGSELPKQFLPIGGKPVLMHTLEAFRKYEATLQIILVLPKEQQDFWKQLCEEYHFDVGHLIADGGETRFHSVKNGLALVRESGLVGVHDGVRPFVSVDVIRNCYDLAEARKAVIPVIDVVETVRHLTGNSSETVSRNDYKLVQTPQVFDTELLKRAYTQEFTPFFTDDASVVEAMGVPVYLAEGNRENIKITTPFDLKIGNRGLHSLEVAAAQYTPSIFIIEGSGRSPGKTGLIIRISSFAQRPTKQKLKKRIADNNLFFINNLIYKFQS